MFTRKQKILLVIFLFISMTIYIMQKRASHYPYDVSKDHVYNFHQANTNIIDLNLKNKKIELTAKNINTNTAAFLKVNVQTTLLGKYFQPNIKIIEGNQTLTQYIAPGAKGIRYINISSLNIKNQAQIRLEGKHVTINDQKVQLVLLKNQDIQNPKILVLATHPDDAEIAAYGLYSNHHNNAYIVTITAGDSGPPKYDEIYHDSVKQYLAKGKVRTWNSITVPGLGGVPYDHCINLGFFDGTLQTMYKDKSTPVKGHDTYISDINTFRQQNHSTLSKGFTGKSDWNSLVENLAYLLKKINPDIIVTPYPALDAHPDHKFSSIALFEAIEKMGIKKGKLYLYTNHFVLSEYYPFGHQGGIVSLPPNFEKPIYFNSIYSFPLKQDMQKEKVLALEAMNDLRLDTEWRFTTGACKIALRHIIKEDILGEDHTSYSYYRRAVRSNELFFVVDISNLYNKEKRNQIIGLLK